MNKQFLSLLLLFFVRTAFGQKNYWQQHVDYKMDVNLDVKTYQYKGNQELTYTNNSPDTLKKYSFIYIIMHFSQEAKWMQDCNP